MELLSDYTFFKLSIGAVIFLFLFNIYVVSKIKTVSKNNVYRLAFWLSFLIECFELFYRISLQFFLYTTTILSVVIMFVLLFLSVLSFSWNVLCIFHSYMLFFYENETCKDINFDLTTKLLEPWNEKKSSKNFKSL